MRHVCNSQGSMKVYMKYETQEFSHRQELYSAILGTIQSSGKPGVAPLIIAPSRNVAQDIREFLGKEHIALGVKVHTSSSWVEDRWMLYGDGSRIVSSMVRTLLLKRALIRQKKTNQLSCSPGTIDLLATLVRESLPVFVAAYESPDEFSDELSDSDRNVLDVLWGYASCLDEQRLKEDSQVFRNLSPEQSSSFPVIVVSPESLSIEARRYFERLATHTKVFFFTNKATLPDSSHSRSEELDLVLKKIFARSEQPTVAPQGAVRFLLPAGRYATPSLLCGSIREAVSHERLKAQEQNRDFRQVVVSAKNPHGRFFELSGVLASSGVSCGVNISKPFKDTRFGKSFVSLLKVVVEEEPDRAWASDFLLSPLSRVERAVAYDLDASWRACRVCEKNRLLSDLRNANEFIHTVIDLMEQKNYEEVLRCFDSNVHVQADSSSAYLSEQLAAISCVREFFQTVSSFELDLYSYLDVLESISVSYSAASGILLEDASEGDCEPDVLFMSLQKASNQLPCTCSTLFLCDMEAFSYPVCVKENNADVLLSKGGYSRDCDVLEEARMQFFHALSSACDQVIVQRVMHTEEADEAYPSVMFEELIDCYSSELDCKTQFEKQASLPQLLSPFVEGASEDALNENLQIALGIPAGEKVDKEQGVVCGEINAFGEVSKSLRCCIAPKRPIGSGESRVLLSASAIEAYLECPYKWFVERRLGLKHPDAQFGPLEKGQFIHDLLKEFYQVFGAQKKRKVDGCSLDEACQLLGEMFDDNLSNQLNIESRKAPLVALTKTEEIELLFLKQNVLAYLEREASFLPQFNPTYFEFAFGYDNDFEYAGCCIRGSIDRIDVNNRGQAVVVDYKGSLSSAYNLSSVQQCGHVDQKTLPLKIQTLIYAQVVKKILNLDVVGALYVSYGKKGGMCGSYDRCVLDSQELGGMSPDECGVPGCASDALGVSSFEELIDAVENRIECALEGLFQGDIEPCPRSTQACGYCPVSHCEKRAKA